METTKSRVAIFPGSFDPFTVGHADIVRRALPLFDRLVIAIGVNEAKKPCFPLEERVAALKKLYADEPRIEVVSYQTLTVEAAHQVGAQFIVRGLRNMRDFEYERDIAEINKAESGIETVFLLTDPRYASVSSSVLRELLSYGKDIQRYLP